MRALHCRHVPRQHEQQPGWRRPQAGHVSRTHYDARGRPVKQTDPRTDSTATPRLGYVANSDRIAWREDGAGNRTNYAYETATGRLLSETNPLNKSVYHAYNLRGQENRTWGAATYPVESVFNDYGERTGLNTYRAGTGWDAGTWPTATTGTADSTTWAYDPATGILTSKTDAAGRTVAYTYTARAQLQTRQWARGVTTTYAYSAATGEQTGITYSDSTPSLAYTYNRLGQSLTVGDVTGTRTFTYSPVNSLLQREDLGAFTGSRSVARQYDSLGRPNLLGFGPAATPTSEYSISYGYDSAGRLNQAGLFNYAYTPNSQLLASVVDTQTGYTQTRTYESNRNLLDVIETKWSTASKAKFDYSTDALGRRTAVAKTGEHYARYGAAGLDTTWGYNDRSELTAEQTKLGGSATVLTGRDDAYAFDNIGNRASATHNGSVATYTANNLNQYSQRTSPGIVDVSGLAPAAATVTVNGSSAGLSRNNDWYFRAFGVTNTTSASWPSLTVASSLGGNLQRPAFVPLSPEAFIYDLDGNLTSDGRWDYTYDAENRLVSMQTHSTTAAFPIANADARRLEFRNDYLGRRVQKTVRAGWNGSTFTTVLSETKFLYHGWNLAAEINASTGALNRSYFWGLDLSGSLQGAGGVGGLLRVQEAGQSYLPAFDGNGNVHGMIKASDGSLAAAYEYDAFGNTLRETGPYAAANPFRFSTKYTDTETGLLYYGLRYYSPSLGRFINRDPIGEQGGVNLYAFVRNNPGNRWDYLGLNPPDDDPYSDSVSDTPTDGSLNGFGSGEFVGSLTGSGGWMGDIYAPTISWDQAWSAYGNQAVAGGSLFIDTQTGALVATQGGGGVGAFTYTTAGVALLTATGNLGAALQSSPNFRAPNSGGLQSPAGDRIGKILTGGALPENSPGYTAPTRALILAIARNPTVNSEIDSVWKTGVALQVETGAWVYRNNTTGALITVRMPLEGAAYDRMSPGAPPSMPGYTAMLTIHTHLDPSPVYGKRIDYPSDADVIYSVDHGIPGLIKNDKGVVPYGPSPLPAPPGNKKGN